MDDDLPSLGVGKTHKKAKISLMLAMGLFFSVYLGRNMYVLADIEPEDKALQSVKNSLSEPKNIHFRFDPMERALIGAQKVELAQKEEEKAKISQEMPEENRPEKEREEKYRQLVTGSPIEAMLPFISKLDTKTAAYLIAIAKKESDWGRYSPHKGEQTCFNYWGYKGGYNLTASGYSCFDSPEQAVAVVGGRIKELLDRQLDTAEKLVVWKCGASCAGHDPAGVRKWISDVAAYYEKSIS